MTRRENKPVKRDRIIHYRKLLWRLLPVLTLFLVLSVQLLVRLRVIYATYELGDLRREILSLDEEKRESLAKYASITIPHEIARRASKELELNPSPALAVRAVKLIKE